MKVCILNALYNHGGASVNALDIASGMASRDHEVMFICSGGESDRCFTQNGYQVIQLGQRKGNPIFHYFNPRLLLKLKKQLEKFQPDIINLHNINLQSFSLGTLLFSKKYPMVWTLHDVWPVCMTGWPATSDCDGFLNDCRNCNSWPRSLVSTNKLIKELVFRSSRFSISCPSSWMASVIQNSELARKHISVIHYAVDSSLFFPEIPASIDVKLDIPNWKKIILFCGGKRLAGELPAWRKGWQYLVDALTILSKNFSDMHLLYVGDTIELPKDFPVSVTFAEGVAHDKMRAYYALADIFVLPTLGDNSPLTILEAMACKTPVVATEVGGVPESVISGETGLLSPPRNAITLAESIGFLLTHPNQALSMAALGYERLINNFNFDEMIERYETLYCDTIAGRP